MAKNPTYKRTPAEKETDLDYLVALYLKGYNYSQITNTLNNDREYNLSRTQVSDDIKKEIEVWKNKRLKEIDEAIALEIQKVNLLENTYWQGWLDSQKSSKSTTTNASNRIRDKQPVGDTYISKGERVEDNIGDPRFLQGVERCIQKRCDLMGLDKPKEIKFNGRLEATNFKLFTEEYTQMKIAE